MCSPVTRLIMPALYTVTLTGTVSLEQAVNRQWNLLEEHVVRLRPVELGRSFGEIHFWTAPGDSELQCASNEIELQRVEKKSADSVPVKEVGCNLEVVTNKGVGFFVERKEDGTVSSDDVEVIQKDVNDE